MTFEASRRHSRWRTVVVMAPALSVLVVLVSSHAGTGHATPVALLVFLAAGAAGVASPVLGVALVLVLTMLADGVTRTWTGGLPPALVRDWNGWLAEIAFLGGALGVGLGLVRTGRGLERASPAERFYVAIFGGIVLGGLIGLAWDWRGQWWYLVRVLWSALPDRNQAAPEYMVRSGLFLISAVIWLRLVRASIREARHAVVVCRVWLAGSLVLAVYGVHMWIRVEGHAPPRVESLLDDVNSYASYLVLTLFVAWAAWLGERRRAARWLAAAALLAAPVMMLLSGSRSAILASMLGSVTMVFSTVRRRRVAAVAALGLAVVFLLAAVVAHAVPNKAAIVQVLREVSSPEFLLTHFRDNRQAVWSAAGRAFLEEPLAGFGPGSLYRRLGAFYVADDPGWRPEQENAHNYFLQLAAETGALGVLAFGALVWSVLRPVLAHWRTSSPAACALALGTLAYLLTCVTGHPLVLARQLVLFWGFLALLPALDGGAPWPAADEPRASRLSPRAAPVLTWLGVAVAVLASAWSVRRQECWPVQAPRGPVAVSFRSGFDGVDVLGWRAMRKAGQIDLCSPPGEARTVDVAVRVVALAVARVLAVHVPGRAAEQVLVPPQGTRLEIRDLVLERDRVPIIVVETQRYGRREDLTGEVARRHLTVLMGHVEVIARQP